MASSTSRTGGVGEQGARHREALLHAVRVGPDRAPRSVGKADVAISSSAARARLATSHAVQAREEGEVFEPRDTEVERAVSGGYEPDLCSHGALGACVRRSRAPDLPSLGVEQPGRASGAAWSCRHRSVRAARVSRPAATDSDTSLERHLCAEPRVRPRASMSGGDGITRMLAGPRRARGAGSAEADAGMCPRRRVMAAPASGGVRELAQGAAPGPGRRARREPRTRSPHQPFMCT